MKMIKYGKHYGDELNELCPICGFDFVHVGETTFPRQEAIPEDENDDLRNVADVRIHFWGECGHKWIREWHTYKGVTIVRVYVPELKQII